MSRKATIHDVAALAGVSIKTVSRVLNREPNVADATREQVTAAVARLGYRPNLSARSLAGARSFLIALFNANPNVEYVAEVQAGIYAAAKAAGYYVIVEPIAHTGQAAAAAMEAALEATRADIVILTPPLCDDPSALAALARRGVAVGTLSPAAPQPGVCYVHVDEEAAAQSLTARLIDLGHRRIGFIAGPRTHGAAGRRRDGYDAALAAAGLAPHHDLIVEGDFSFRSGLDAGHALLAKPVPPTAIFAANDEMAAGVIAAAAQAGLRVPADLSVAGFDGARIGAIVWPPIASMRQPLTDMAFQLAERLILGRKEDAPDGVRFACAFVDGGSLGPPPAGSNDGG